MKLKSEMILQVQMLLLRYARTDAFPALPKMMAQDRNYFQHILS